MSPSSSAAAVVASIAIRSAASFDQIELFSRIFSEIAALQIDAFVVSTFSYVTVQCCRHLYSAYCERLSI